MSWNKIVVVGGPGMVGRTVIEVLASHQIPFKELVSVGKDNAGKKQPTPFGELTVKPLSLEVFAGAEIAFFAAGATVSQTWIPQVLDRCQQLKIIDLSSAWRQAEGVPLVIPALNGETIGEHRLITCPNCTIAIALMVLAPLHREYSIKKVYLASYQAASGAGKACLDALEQQVYDWAVNRRPPVIGKTGNHFYPLAGNVIPCIGEAKPEWSGYTGEEIKTHEEANKIFFQKDGQRPAVPIISTCVCVPVKRCHSEVLNIQTEFARDLSAIKDCLSFAPGVILLDNAAKNFYPMPLNMEGKEKVGVGRLRLNPEGEITLWVCGDQLLRGAALTAVEVLEYLAKK